MNQRQRSTVIVGLLAAIAMACYPPWQFVRLRTNGELLQPAGYAVLFSPPKAFRTVAPIDPASGQLRSLDDLESHEVEDLTVSPRIDFARLGLQWAMVVLATAAATLAFRRPVTTT